MCGTPSGWHEGLKPVRMVNIEMLEGQLNRFIMFDDETP
jgi:hypothetical protein